jgi:hypothetical protein
MVHTFKVERKIRVDAPASGGLPADRGLAPLAWLVALCGTGDRLKVETEAA